MLNRNQLHAFIITVVLLPGGITLLWGQSGSSPAPRYMERLDRGLVAVWQGSNKVWLSWRLAGNEPANTAFHIYRDGVRITNTPLTGATCYQDTKGAQASLYRVTPVVNGRELAGCAPATVWATQYLTVPLQTPAGYTPNDASAGDLDGDGAYEIVLHQTGVGKDNSQSGYTDGPILQAYKLDGTMLWEINLGINIREGAHYTQFMVYDLDSDGRAEVICKTADGTVDGASVVIGDPSADWRNSSGYVLEGPEYLTVFDGPTGAALDTVDYVVPRGTVSSWGDGYGNRVDRFLACVAYLDGERPSVVMCRGYYTRAVLAAWDFRFGRLTQRWVFDSDDGTAGNSAYRGQGNHNLSVADVDGDGRDEIIYGACAIDDNGTGLHSTGLGHGDALHVSDLDPSRPGLEIFDIHEGSSTPGASFRDAWSGEILWQTANADVGRGVAADIDARYAGAECWGFGGIRSCAGAVITATNPPSTNHVLWWDGDLMRELLDGTVIDKWNGASNSKSRLLTAYNYGAAANNGTKNNPCLQADILGDWREEAVWRHSDNQHLLIFTTTIATNYRFVTLMHDPAYRLSVAWQNVAYNQPTQMSYYLGEGMAAAPAPNLVLAGDSERGLLRQWWTGIDGSVVADLTGAADYPDQPAGEQVILDLEGPVNWDNSYGQRLRGYVVAPVDGTYTFWIAGDDNCQLWLSGDAQPDNRVCIASVARYTAWQRWDSYASQKSVPMALAAGHKYYLEALHKEGAGADHLAVAWEGPGLARQVIRADYLRPWKAMQPGDLNQDKVINLADFAGLAALWLVNDCGLELRVDLNGDCQVGPADLAVLTGLWTRPVSASPSN